jgi:hypothetical protein
MDLLRPNQAEGMCGAACRTGLLVAPIGIGDVGQRSGPSEVGRLFRHSWLLRPIQFRRLRSIPPICVLGSAQNRPCWSPCAESTSWCTSRGGVYASRCPGRRIWPRLDVAPSSAHDCLPVLGWGVIDEDSRGTAADGRFHDLGLGASGRFDGGCRSCVGGRRRRRHPPWNGVGRRS